MSLDLPPFAADVLAARDGLGAVQRQGAALVAEDGSEVGRVENGILRTPVPEDDSGVAFYRAVGGAHFHERRAVPYAMTTLDTPVYHGYLADYAPQGTEAIIVDVGGGDGRNALPWIERGHRVVVVDPALDALDRFRGRLAEAGDGSLERVLLIEADARRMPLRNGVSDFVQAIETLAYLNDDYAAGLAECRRVMTDGGRLFVADRDYEAGLLTRLFYRGGVAGMLEQSGTRSILDGNAERTVQSRCFTASELAALIEATGFEVEARHGISAISLVLGFLRSQDRIEEADQGLVPEVEALLRRLGREGRFLRSHVAVARKSGR